MAQGDKREGRKRGEAGNGRRERPDKAARQSEKAYSRERARPVARGEEESGKDLATMRIHRLSREGRGVLALVLVYLLTVVVIAPTLYHKPVGYEVGQKLPVRLTAEVSFSMVDQEALREQIHEARTSGKEFYYQYDDAVVSRSLRAAGELFEEARRLAAREGSEPAAAAEELAAWSRERLDLVLEPDLAALLIRNADAPEVAEEFERALRRLYQTTGVVDDLERYRRAWENNRVVGLETPDTIPESPTALVDWVNFEDFVESQFGPGGLLDGLLRRAHRELISGLVVALARPNLVFQARHTEAANLAKTSAIQADPPQREFAKGEVLARAGETLDRETMQVLQRMDAVQAQAHYKRLLAIMVYVALLVCLVFYYIMQFRKDIDFTANNVMMIGSLVLFALALGRIPPAFVDESFLHASRFAFPAALIGMMATILLDARSAVLMVTVGALANSIATELDFKVLLASLLGGWAAVSALTAAQERREVLKAGLLAGLVNFGVILLIHFIDDPKQVAWQPAFWGLASGAFCGGIALSTLRGFEYAFGVITDVRLLELTGLDHPLLKDLEEKAPGSYQHSLNVMKLSETAAKAIGANYLLVRAGAAFHDVGKVLKPKYFSENQISINEKSLHSKISPFMSAMVIKNHVKGGIELARKYKLPERIIDFIPQHQGTAVITYFYHEALKRFENSQSTDPVLEEDFRYPGPTPQNVETAIVMLADTVDATVTSRFSGRGVNEDELRLCVQKTIADKFNDGQFDDCELTLRDLHDIRESFVQTLIGRFHHRVKYPSKQETSSMAAAGAARREKAEREKTEREESPEKKAVGAG